MITIVIFSFITACISIFGKYLINNSEIISWYYDYLHRLNKKNNLLAKPLGLCVYCFGTWVSIFSFFYAKTFHVWLLYTSIEYMIFETVVLVSLNMVFIAILKQVKDLDNLL